MDKYFQKPVVKFSTGKGSCSLVAHKAAHVLQALEENGSAAVIRALESLMTMPAPVAEEVAA